MKVGIATDHNGVEEKKEIINYLTSLGYETIDLSKENTPTDDYPTFASTVGKEVISKSIDLGILMCGTGIGMSIAANKIKGIRCAKVSNTDEALFARSHNDANIIALSYKTPLEELKSMIKTFLETPFSGDERHVRRISKITEIEDQND